MKEWNSREIQAEEESRYAEMTRLRWKTVVKGSTRIFSPAPSPDGHVLVRVQQVLTGPDKDIHLHTFTFSAREVFSH